MKEFLFKSLHARQTSASNQATIQVSNQSSNRGFTLIELLIVVLIAGGIISGLMFMVVELLTADQKEASKNQTQQEMQMAMDYISAELRQAVYVYDSTCLSSSANGTAGATNYCPGLYNHLPTDLNSATSTPIVAFWKHEQLPEVVRDDCVDGTTEVTDPDDGTKSAAEVPCIAGHAYSLVVYSTDTSDSATWDGKSRITRYSLDKYTVSGTDYSDTKGYVDPSAYANEFKSWPYYQASGETTPTNKQTAAGTPATGTQDVLVDFVDDQVQVSTPTSPGTSDTAACPTGYGFSTSSTITGFYGCVSTDDATTTNRDIILSLRGNAAGRPAINGDSVFLPILETHVLSRPVLGKTPD